MKKQYSAGDIVLGNWKLIELIGEGSFGRVFEAEREDFGTTYKAAIKIITIPQSQAEITSARAEGMDDDSVTAYFRSFVEEIVREFALMSELKGTANVVSYEDHTVDQNEEGIGWNIIIRMELLTPLLDYSAEKKFTRQDVIKLGIDICKALELCQKFNILHRDIKPENIFVSKLGDYKLGDFGIARTAEKTMSGLSKKGTYTYMAPEIYRGDAYGSSVDIYSLGIVLYRLLNDNRAPFLPEYPKPITHNEREAALAKRISGTDLPLPKNADGRLAEIVLKACAYDPKDRYSSPMQMREELEAITYSSEEAAIIYPMGDAVPQKSLEYVDAGKIPEVAPVKNAKAANSQIDPDKTEVLLGGSSTNADFDKTEFISGSSGAFSGVQSTDNEEAQKKLKKKRAGIIVAACVVLLAVALVFALPDILNDDDLYAGELIGYQDAEEYGENENYDETEGIENDSAIPDYITIAGQRFSTSLTELELIDMNLTDVDIAQLGYMTNLTVLRLNNNNISDISPLASLINLESLNLSGNNISNIAPLFGLTSLTNLSLAYNPVTDWHAVTHVANVWGRPADFEVDQQLIDDLLNFQIGVAQTTQGAQTQPQGQQGNQSTQQTPPQGNQLATQQQNVTVPNIVGQSRFSATSTLQNAGFTVNVREETSNTVAAGNVISQNPTAGSSRVIGSSVTITVSAGPQTQQPQTPPQSQTITVRYNANGGTGAPSSHVVTLSHGTATFNLSSVRPTRSGHTFLGWRLENDTAFGIDSPGQQISIVLHHGATITYFAQWQSNQQQTVNVPNVVGQNRTAATSTLQNAGFTVSIREETSSTVASGNVISQSPSAGSSRATGSSVTITVSKGAPQPQTVNVPNVVGQSRSAATSTLQNAGFAVNVTETTSNTVTSGNVISQSPSAGSSQTVGSSVTITVSTGAPVQLVNVPNVVGENRFSAARTLENAGFVVNVVEESNLNVREGNVISQSPAVGGSQARGSTITIHVNIADVQPIPNVVGQSVLAASTGLQVAGFHDMVFRTTPGEPSMAVDGRPRVVTAQSPAAGSLHLRGSVTITMTYALQ